MQLRLVHRFGAAALACAVVSIPVSGRAQFLDLSVLEQSDAYVFQFFRDVDDVQVVTHSNAYSISFENQTDFRVQLTRQTVVVPAVDAPPGSEEAVDAITSASRPLREVGDAFREYSRNRHEATLDLSRPRWNAGYYVSSEEDYFAQMFRAGLDRDLVGTTLNIAAGASYGWDSIQPLEDADTDGVSDHRRTAYANVVTTWILSPRTVLRAGLEHFRVDGLQHNPYRNVYVDGGNLPELHPDTRNRSDVYLRLHRYLAMRASVKLLWKHYFDSWGVRSNTFGARLSQYVGDDVVVRYRYRYYRQSHADFFSEDYAEPGGIDGYRTGDYRLGDFGAHLFGTRMSWSLGRVIAERGSLRSLSLQLGYERYFNSNNFSANIFEAGIALDF